MNSTAFFFAKRLDRLRVINQNFYLSLGITKTTCLRRLTSECILLGFFKDFHRFRKVLIGETPSEQEFG